MKTLVIGGTGTVGSLVVKELLRRDQQVRVLITSAEKADELPASVEFRVGNLDQPGTLPKAFEGVDRVFLLNRQSLTEVAQGMYAVFAAQRAGVSKIVYLSIHNVRQGGHLPHFRPKVSIENAIIRTGMNYTFICANNFYQNDLWFARGIVDQGLYTQPIGHVGLSRVDVRDIAEATVTALLSDEWNGQSIPLVGPEILNGEETARILSEELGYAVSYAGNDLEAWSARVSQCYPAWLVQDWVETFLFFQRKGLTASAEDIALVTNVLGRAPRSYAEFVNDYADVFQLKLELA